MQNRSAAHGDTEREPTAVSLTVALPVYNEEKVLDRLHALLTSACSAAGARYEILYVNDGSSDGTGEVLERLAATDAHVSVVELSRNFGHPAALAAGIDLASGRTLILMDADMQDDPGVIPELLRLQSEQGAEVVYVTRARRRENLLMRTLFSSFHWLLARTSTYHVPRDAGSFGLMGPRALAEVRRISERLRYFPGLRAFVGFKQASLTMPRGERYDAMSRVGFRGLVRLAAMAFFAESRAPVTLFYLVSAASMLVSAGLIGYAVLSKVLGIAVVSWASTLTAIAFFSGVIMLGQAFICEYLARVYEEVRRRPIYIVDRVRAAGVITREEAGAPQRA